MLYQVMNWKLLGIVNVQLCRVHLNRNNTFTLLYKGSNSAYLIPHFELCDSLSFDCKEVNRRLPVAPGVYFRET